MLNLALFLCYRKIAEEEWHDQREKQSPILWPGIYSARAFLDPGSGVDLCRDQPNRVVVHRERTAGVEATQWRSQRPRVPESFGEIGKPWVFEASGEPGDRTEERYETTHCASKRGHRLGQAVWECGGVFAPGYGAGKECETAPAFQGSCKPVPLPRICHALWSEASVPGVRDAAWKTSVRMCSVFQPGLADEDQGSMDWLGRCDTRARSQQIENNSRLLVLPRIRNLASALLSRVWVGFERTGKVIMEWIPGWWRRWWTGNGFMVGVTVPPILSYWGKQQVEVAWTVSISIMGRK